MKAESRQRQLDRERQQGLSALARRLAHDSVVAER